MTNIADYLNRRVKQLEFDIHELHLETGKLIIKRETLYTELESAKRALIAALETT